LAGDGQTVRLRAGRLSAPASRRARPDAELVRACRMGDERSWAELVERYSRYVYAILVRAYSLSEDDAEEVFQEVFVRAWERIGQLRHEEALRPWIGQLARRLAIDRLRAARREAPAARPLELAEREAERELERIELALGVRAAMEALPEPCQDILDRFFAQEQNYREISAALGIAPGTVASRISRCLSRLRETLRGEQRGGCGTGER
jgi:RNA polymerase sigma-70 factor (ECF subfamily)